MALVITGQPIDPGVKFFTEDENALQVGWHSYPQGKVIKPHRHLPAELNKVINFQEVLYIQEGKVRVLFFDEEGNQIHRKDLGIGDTIVLIAGGHGFEFLEPTKMLEVKQGPYNPNSRSSIERKTPQ